MPKHFQMGHIRLDARDAERNLLFLERVIGVDGVHMMENGREGILRK